jgi:K+-sensing histidine kinase KdpD
METESSAAKTSAPQHLLDRNIFRYGLALGSVALALGIGFLAWYYSIRHVDFTVLLFAIAVTAWYGGIGPAMLAVLFSSLGYAYFFAPPDYSFAVSREELPHYVLFVARPQTSEG